MSLHKSISVDGSEIIISLPQKFDFQMHKEFKHAYEKSGIKSIILDMNKTQYMDSSALGMLLQLKEYSEQCNFEIRMKNANSNIIKIMQIAHFDKLFKMT